MRWRERIKRSWVTVEGREQWGWDRERHKVLFLKPLKERKWMNWVIRGSSPAGAGGAVLGNPQATSHWLTQQLIQHPNHISSRGKPFHPSPLKYRSGEKGGGLCVYKEHTDGLLTFTVINNVVAQLEQTTGWRKRLPWRTERGWDQRSHWTGLEQNNGSLVLSNIYERGFAP